MKVLLDSQIIKIAKIVGIEPNLIKAVCEVESPEGGFLADGRPIILFERHKFEKLTGGIYNKSHSHISNKVPGGYLGGEKEHLRLGEAAKLNRSAALQSTSWGKFQIMGFNYALCGFVSLQSFINAMYRSEEAQLMAFIKFITSQKLIDHLKNKDWKKFARGYNGPAYARNKYDKKLEAAYKKLT